MMRELLFAKLYDYLMKDAEERGLQDWRQELLSNLPANVLEIGCGTGANLKFYTSSIENLILVEPSLPMSKELAQKIPFCQAKNVRLLQEDGEKLSLAEASCDAVICTLVLCSVKNPAKVLAEIHRVLRPQGQLIFIEHVAAFNNIKRYKWQLRLAFLWKYFTAGCHTTRDTEENIKQAGFSIEKITRQSMRGVPPIVRPSIRGVATKI